MKNRGKILAQAQSLIDNKGSVENKDYQCPLHPFEERFIVNWFNSKFPVCYSLDELVNELKKENK